MWLFLLGLGVAGAAYVFSPRYNIDRLGAELAEYEGATEGVELYAPSEVGDYTSEEEWRRMREYY